MKIIGNRADGSLDAELEFKDGPIQPALQSAQFIATEEQQVVHFEFNGTPIAIGPDTNLEHVRRLYHFHRGDRIIGFSEEQIGPDIDPSKVPPWDHGTEVVTIALR